MSRRGAADVDRDEVADAGAAGLVAGADDAGGGARKEQADRPLAGDLGRGKAAARLHDLQRRRAAGGGERRLHAGEIVVDHGLDVGVEAGGGGALVFAEGGVDLGRERDRDAWHGRADGARGDGLLVRRVREGEQQADGDRLDPRGFQRGDGAPRPRPGRAASTTAPSAAMRSRTSARRAPGASQPGVSGFSARS